MLKQEQKLQQRQTLSPQQIQAIRLLELPEIELEEQIKQELIDNPALDEGEERPKMRAIQHREKTKTLLRTKAPKI